MIACKGSLALHSFRVSVSDSELYICIYTYTERRLPNILQVRECSESLSSSKCYGCVLCVKIQSECSNNVEVI